MPFVPNLAKTASTDPQFPPHCSNAVPRRKPPGASFVWTLTLGWEWTDEDATPTLPAPFSRDLDEIERAASGDGPAYVRKSHLQREVECRIDVRVGQDKLPIFKGASAIVKSIEVSAAKGGGSCKVLLAVEVKRNNAPELLDCIDADVDVHVTTDGELFPDGAEPGDHERGDGEDEDQEAGGAPNGETLTQARARRRGKATASDLPPEA